MHLSFTTRSRLALLLVAATVLVAVTGIGQLVPNSHYAAYFDDSDPRLVAHNDIATRYSRQDSVAIVLMADSSFLSGDHYVLLEDLTSALLALPVAARVTSVPELGILGDTLHTDGSLLPSLEQLAAESDAVGLLISENAKVACLLVHVRLPDTQSQTVLDSMAQLRQLVDETIAHRPVTAHYTGSLPLNEAYIQVVKSDLSRILPVLLVIMLTALTVLLRSWRAAFTVLPVGIFATLAAFGVVGLTGAELAAINAFAPVMILTVSLAGTVHMALSYARHRNQAETPTDAAMKAAAENALPMSLASGTTALGFLGLLFSPSPPIQVMGLLLAVGIVVAFLLCMTLLPVLQARVDPWRPGAMPHRFKLGRLAQFVVARRLGIAAVAALLVLPATWLASQNVVSDNLFEYFSESHAYHRDTQLATEHLSGVSEFLYSVDTGEAFGLFDAGAIERLGAFTDWLKQQPEVVNVVSLAGAHPLVEAQQDGRLQGRLDYYRARLSDSVNPLLALTVSNDYASSLVSVYLRPLDSRRMLDFDERTLDWARNNLDDTAVHSGGATLMFANLGEKNIRSMLSALLIALAASAIALGVIFRSLRIGLIALACNALPILFVYSLWAVVNGQIGIGAAVVMGMVLGILLDDTIYLLASFRHGVKRSVAQPVSWAMERVGPALVITTLTLVAGLSLGVSSGFGPIWSMSLLSVLVIGTALLVDLILLPALLPASRTQRKPA
ncbi:MAG: MMPL family transporter [Pseudomonadota bacterium]